MLFPRRRVDAASIYLLYVAADGCIRGLLYTVLAVYFVLRVGMDPLQLVLIGTILEASCFVFEIPTGVLADTYSRRFSIVLGETLFGLAYVVEGTVPLFVPIALAEVVRAIGETCLSGALQAWVAGEVSAERLARLFVRGVQARRAGRLVGIALSAGLANIDLQLPLVMGGVLALLVAATLTLSMPEQGFIRAAPTAHRSMFKTAREGLRSVAANRVLVFLLLLATLGGAASEGVDRLWEAHLLRDFSLPAFGELAPVTWFGVIEAGGLVVGIAAIQLVSRVRSTAVERIAQLTSAAILVRAIGVAILALTGAWPVAMLARWLYVGLQGVTGPLLDAWIARNTPAEVRATVYSTLSQGDAFGQAFGGPALGAIGTWVSLRAAILGSALLMLPGIGFMQAAAGADCDKSRRQVLSIQ